MRRDGILKTVLVAATLCLVCSLLVSLAAISLRDRQAKNVELFRKSNVLAVAGLDAAAIQKAGGVAKAFEGMVQEIVIDLRTGAEAREGLSEAMKLPAEQALAKYDPVKAAKNAKQDPRLGTVFTDRKADIAGLGVGRENYSSVYRFQPADGGDPVWIFPVRGRGLWSTLKGFVALESDLQTIRGLTFYEHAETPGLGGEVDNPAWKQKWHGKQVFGADGHVAVHVVKGAAESTDRFGVDGLSGATITSAGVSHLLEYWLGPEGFGPFIQRQRGGAASADAAVSATSH